MPKAKEKITVSLERPEKKKERRLPSTVFQKGNPWAFQKGVSGNPGGRAKSDLRLVSKNLLVQLPCRAPDAVCSALGLPNNSSWAACLSASLLRHAVIKGDMGAARLIIETTEGTRAKLELTDESGNAISTNVMQLVFVDADGNGRPATTIEGLIERPATASDDDD